MPLDHETTLKHLFEARQRLSAAAWLVVCDGQAAEDLFQNVALKSVYDMPVVETIREAAEADGWKFSRIVAEIAKSYPFTRVRR